MRPVLVEIAPTGPREARQKKYTDGALPAHAVHIWQAPASTRRTQSANEGRAVGGVEGHARLEFPARGRSGRPAETQGDFRGGAKKSPIAPQAFTKPARFPFGSRNGQP